MRDYIVYHTNKKGETNFIIMNETDKDFLSINTIILDPLIAHSKTKAITKTKTYEVHQNVVLVS